MIDKTLMTYSLLSHLKESRGADLSGILEIFSPIVKKAIYEFAQNKGITEVKGKNISEIQKKVNDIFGIEIPLSVLRLIFKQIETELQDESIFKIYADDAFVINSFVFTSLDDDIQTELKSIEFLKNDFKDFCENNNQQIDFSELTSFLFTLKIELFTEQGNDDLDVSFLIPKYIQLRFKDFKVKKILSDLYLGNLLTSYLEYNISTPVSNTELLVDTNFFISLIDLNTNEAHSTCKHLYEFCISMGYRFSILYSTVEQIKILINSRVRDFSNKDLGLIKEADIFGACIRRNLDKTQLERILDSIDALIREYKFDLIHEARIRSIIDEAKKSQKYIDLKELRRNSLSALHDTVAYFYVERKRGKNIREFSDVKCWFLNNSYNHDYYSNKGYKIHERIKICASELLTLLWLANPSQKNLDLNIVSQGGLATYVAKYKNQKIPSDKVILDIRNRAEQALKVGAITEKDVFSVSVRMAEGQLTNGEAQEFVQMPDEEFIDAVKNFSSEELNLHEKIRFQNETLEKQASLLEKIIADNIEQKLLISIQNYEKKRDEQIDIDYTKQSIRMNNVAWLYLLFFLLLCSAWFINDNYNSTLPSMLATIIGVILFLVPMWIPFIEHRNVFKCLKFTFLKRSRLLIKREIINELVMEYEKSIIRPSKENIENELKVE